jgi:thiamine-monophosphate kinase
MDPGLGPGPEFDLIRSFLRDLPRVSGDVVRVGPGDDCAVIGTEGITLTIDMAVEGVHFRREWLTPEEIGYRAAAAAVSDLAAMAAEPLGLLVALAIPAPDGDEAKQVMQGVAALARSVSATLLGGDVTRSPGPLVVDIVAVGRTAQPVLRSGAAPGDELWVTGRLGGAAAAVRAWRSGDQPAPAAREAFARPTPRTAEALWLAAQGGVTAMLDLSDGLAGDAGHVATASRVGVVVDAAAVPIHAAAATAATDDDGLAHALGGGEDYELLLAAVAGRGAELADEFRTRFAVELTRIGTVVEGSGVWLRQRSGAVEAMPLGGYDHMRMEEE